MVKRYLPVKLILPILALLIATSIRTSAAELVRTVRSKISAGDLASAAAQAEDYKKKTGVDAEYLDAVGWLARGAEMMNKLDLAATYVAELKREIPQEKADLLSPFGAMIEVNGKLLAAREGRGEALRFLEAELSKTKDLSLRARIRKNINMLSLEGQAAPELNIASFVGAEPARLSALKGKTVLLFLWAHWCGDCKAQVASLARVAQKYRAQGLVVIAPTRLYGSGPTDKVPTPEEEKAHIQKVWTEFYAPLEGVSAPIDTETMLQYGVSATPTFVLIDRKGIVRLYTPTRLSEAEMSKRIDALLAEPL